MELTFKLSNDKYQRKKLQANVPIEDEIQLLAFTWFKDQIWWSKSSAWNHNINISVMYHHCMNTDRQVQVMANGSFIQDCVIPNNYDPEEDQTIDIKYLTPIIVFDKIQHGFGFILFPKETVKSKRNGIWVLKEQFYNDALSFFEPALSKSRKGSILGFSIDKLL
jgi:hypothetical protein